MEENRKRKDDTTQSGRDQPLGDMPAGSDLQEKRENMSEPVDPYIPIPVEAAREIAEKYGKAIVIINAWDNVYGLLHTTTYGADPQNKAYAAMGGEITVKALGGLRQASTDFEDYRLAMAKLLREALKEARQTIIHLHRPPALEIYLKNSPEMQRLDAALAKATEFLG